MAQTAAQQEFQISVNSFITASREHYGSYAHAAGYLSSTVVEMFEHLTKKQQKFMLQSFQEAAARQQKEAKAKPKSA
jgi:hypothetical protein